MFSVCSNGGRDRTYDILMRINEDFETVFLALLEYCYCVVDEFFVVLPPDMTR